MSTIEYFKNAPVGATATHNPSGGRAMKTDDVERRWMLPNGLDASDEEMEQLGYTLDQPAPTTAREALDLAWELAHPVKEGQVLPEGTRYMTASNSGVKEYTAPCDVIIRSEYAMVTRTVEPLPVPEPDWLDAPAVIAHVEDHNLQGTAVFSPAHGREGRWARVGAVWTFHWDELRDVTPLYPKGQEA